MFCGHCGARRKEEDRFCGKCGVKLPENEPEVVYIEEKPIEPILDNISVIILTVFFFALSLATIIGISALTKDISMLNIIERIPSQIHF